jgi:Fe-S cluster biosynthesis and repair protein YggX
MYDVLARHKSSNGSSISTLYHSEAWKLWLEFSKMVMNEYRLNPLDPNSQKIMEEQMEQFLFGEGARLPEGYVPPKAKRLAEDSQPTVYSIDKGVSGRYTLRVCRVHV